jgi:acyl-CoA thioester hydrolase
MLKLHFGPILFREECTFRREIHFGDDINIDTMLVESRPDYSRWTMRHRIMRGEEVCATIIIEGAWLDTNIRKLTAPPEVGAAALALLPHVNGEE